MTIAKMMKQLDEMRASVNAETKEISMHITAIDRELERCQEFRGFLEMMRKESKLNPKS